MSDQKFKADAGKLKTRLLFEDVPRSLLLASAVLSYGEQKYEAHSWKGVETERYKDAKMRHFLDELAGLGESDEESGLLHAGHELINTMFVLEQRLEKFSPEEFRELLKFNKPPTDHKDKT